MRDLTELDYWRQNKLELDFFGQSGDSVKGVFRISSPVDHAPLNVIATSGCGWDHVSLSRSDRTPSWREMEIIRRSFFKPDECVMQIHPPLHDYIDGSRPGGNARFTLHLWRPTKLEIPRPPLWMVGARDKNECEQFSKIAEQSIAQYEAENK